MGWAEDYAEDKEKQQRQLRLRISSYNDYDPAVAARIFGVAAKTRLPQAVVAEDLEGLERSLKRKEFNYDNYTDEKNGSPIFNAFADESPYNFAVLDRDRKHMNQVERSVDDVWLGYKSGRATTQLADLSNRGIENGGNTPEELARMDDLRDLLEGGDFGAEGHVMRLLVGTARQAPIMGWIGYEALDEGLMLGAAGAAYGFATGTPGGLIGQTIGIGAGATLGLSAGMIAGAGHAAFDLERGLAYDQYIQSGFDPKDALLFANVVGGLNMLPEMIGFGALTKRIPGVRGILKDRVGDAVAEIFAKPTMKHAVARASVQYGEGVLTEVVTEIFQDTTLMMAEEHMKSVARDAGDTRPEMAMGEIPLFEQWKQTAIHTLYGTLILGSAGPIMNYKADAKRARDALARQESWSRLKEGTDESTTRKEAKSMWDEFISRISKDGPVDAVRYSQGAWKEYWQSQKIDPDKAAADLGIDVEGMSVLDDDIVIPLEIFIEKIVPTDHFAGLQNDLRVTPDSMTPRESRQWFADQEAIVERVKKEIEQTGDTTVIEEMTKDITGMLMSGGRFDEQASTTQAKMFALKVYNLATKEGKDPKAFLAKYLETIQRQLPEGLVDKDFDIDVDPLLDSIRAGKYPHQRDIYGNNLIDFIRGVGGIQDDGGEMSSRDLNNLRPGTVSSKGKSIDAMAELAQEAGYIAEADEKMLVEALDKELMGSPVYSQQHQVDTALEGMLNQMETVARFLEEENIDLNDMTNTQVRDYLKGVKTLNQSTPESLREWTNLMLAVSQMSEQAAGGAILPNQFDTMLTKAEAAMPRVAANQNFKDVEFTDRVDDNRTVKYSAQDRYNNAVRSRNMLKQLAKCVSG
jgi:hypothetical protein